MARSGVLAVSAVVILGLGVIWYLTSSHNTVVRAYQAISRADEYWKASELLFEPRYLDAEKAVAELQNSLDPLQYAKAHECLSDVLFARQALRYGTELDGYLKQAISEHDSSRKIAELRTDVNNAEETLKKRRSDVEKCIAGGGN